MKVQVESLPWYLAHPRHWFVWFLFSVWWVLSQLPYPILMRLGNVLGAIFFRFDTDRKRIAKRNIDLCFPSWDDFRKKKLLRENFASMGKAVFEIGIAWWWSEKRFVRLITFEGEHHLNRDDERGTVLLGIHYTTLEIGAAAATFICDKLDGMYRAHSNPVFDYIQARGRMSKAGGTTKVFERRDVRACLRGLKSGRALWFGPDQDYGLGSGIFAPFFNIPAATVNTTARFSKSSNARVVPFSHVRMPNCEGYKVIFYPPIEHFPVGNDLDDAILINRIIEKLILLQPEQYLWVHRRFKNRPAGESDVYF
tara:strand:- start:2874 stop:3803 length:930 start_codon:yes stop_codon:yes gene_type:complete